MKKLIRNLANNAGLDIVKKTKIELTSYDNYPKESLDKRRFYNIGAGTFYHPYWTNIDYETEHYKSAQKASFMHHDLMAMTSLPIEDNVAEIIYSSHTIEHVSDAAVRNMLKESYRILKKGGGIRLTTPNAWLEHQAYLKNDISYWYWIKNYSNKNSWEKIYTKPLSETSIHQIFLHHFASQLCEINKDDSPEKKYSDTEISNIFSKKPYVDTLDYFTQQCEFNPKHPESHINWWTYKKIISFLKEAGFTSPYISGCNQSIYPVLRDPYLFDSTHPRISLYIEAQK